VIAWTERGGPPVAEPTGLVGYGSKLLIRSVTRQLNGSMQREWDEAGVAVTLTMNIPSN
jgi:two-component sensor histidine kinase